MNLNKGIKLGLNFSIVSIIISTLGFLLMLFIRAISYEGGGFIFALISYVLILPSIIFLKISLYSFTRIFFEIFLNLICYFLVGFIIGIISKDKTELKKDYKFFIKILIIFIIIPLLLAITISYLSTRCELIKSNSERSQCYYDWASEKLDTSICFKSIETNAEDVFIDCITRIAVKRGDVSICNLISNHAYKTNVSTENWFNICVNTIQINSAGKTGDTSNCDSIADSDQKNYCIAISKKDSSYCDLIINSDYLKDFCYSRVAFLLKNSQTCEKMGNEGMKDECLKAVSK